MPSRVLANGDVQLRFRITNVSPFTLRGPLALVLIGKHSRVVVHPSGFTTLLPFRGKPSPFIFFDGPFFGPGASTLVKVRLSTSVAPKLLVQILAGNIT